MYLEKYRGKKCVVLGGGGFIGTNLCRRLISAGVSLRAFGRSQRFPNAVKDVPWTTGTLNDQDSLAHVLNGADIVFHLVGPSSPALVNQRMVQDVEENIIGTIRLLETCHRLSIPRLVFVSSGGTVYGAPTQIPIQETAPTEPISAYGISKLTAEKYLVLFDRLHGLNHRILRVANPFGPFQLARHAQGVVAAFLERALDKQTLEIWGSGNTVRDYIYIDDVCEGLLLAGVNDGPSATYNIGSGIGRSLNQIAEDISKLIGCSIPINHQSSRSIDVQFNILDIKLAEKELGWTPRTSWEDGLSRTFDWISTWKSSGRT